MGQNPQEYTSTSSLGPPVVEFVPGEISQSATRGDPPPLSGVQPKMSEIAPVDGPFWSEIDVEPQKTTLELLLASKIMQGTPRGVELEPNMPNETPPRAHLDPENAQVPQVPMRIFWRPENSSETPPDMLSTHRMSQVTPPGSEMGMGPTIVVQGIGSRVVGCPKGAQSAPSGPIFHQKSRILCKCLLLRPWWGQNCRVCHVW